MAGNGGIDGFKINRPDFAFNGGVGRAMESEGSEDVVKSSYEIPADLHRKVRVLGARRGVRLNVLLKEALEDLLEKYGEDEQKG